MSGFLLIFNRVSLRCRLYGHRACLSDGGRSVEREISKNNLPAGRISANQQLMTQKIKKPHHVFTLLVNVGRKEGDGLPDGASGAALMCYASGVDEGEAVRETVAILKHADLAPLDVSGYGTLDERLAEGHDIPKEERELMARALAENSVIIAQMTPFFDDAPAH